MFTKGGETRNVFFYDVEADGLSLDDKREFVEKNDLPHCLSRWRSRDAYSYTDRTDKSFLVPVAEIRDADYDLSVRRYRQIIYEEEVYDTPRVILGRMKSLNDEIVSDLAELAEIIE